MLYRARQRRERQPGYRYNINSMNGRGRTSPSPHRSNCTSVDYAPQDSLLVSVDMRPWPRQ
ncbi:hypothetical protein J6590_000943 [Homalodisca vitripennis]|nr:hypothetical protein J6590_000943 [Homalodisca vitripennis]